MKTKLKLFAITSLIVTFFSGCVIHTSKYEQKINYLPKFNMGKIVLDKENSMLAAQNSKNAVKCSLHTMITTPKYESFHQYIENAFVEELINNKLYSENKFVNKFYVKSLDVTSSPQFGFAYWQFELTLASDTTKDITVSSRYNFDSHPDIEVACSRFKNAFTPAVDQLLQELFEHPSFEKLFQR